MSRRLLEALLLAAVVFTVIALAALLIGIKVVIFTFVAVIEWIAAAVGWITP